MTSQRRLMAMLLHPIRRNGRRVAWTPEFMGWGNLLQLGMWAYEGSRAGEPRWIRATPKLTPWLVAFPGLRRVALLPSELRFTDRRVAPWSEAARAAGVDSAVALHAQVDVAGVERFLRDVVLPGSTLESSSTDSVDDVLVVNVRRGDYYADEQNRAQYGFAVGAYVRTAVNASAASDGSPASIVVVSDDLEWCRRELSWLSDIAPTSFPASRGPIDDFLVVSAARRMVITNSTFSYWAAHVSNVRHGDNHQQVWAPRFFDRTQNGGRSWLLDERWSVVEEMASGWDEPDAP